MLAKIPWYSIGRFALIVLCLAIVLTLVVTVLPVYLDITAFKGPVEEILSGVAEAPVTVDEIRLHPSLWPTLRVSGVEIAGSREQSSPPFSRIDGAEVKISLLPLLRRQLRLQRLLISGATFHAHRPEGQSGNWPTWSESSFEIKELADIEIENATFHLEDHDTVRATMIVDHLTCDIAKNRPLDLQLQGSLEGLPLSVSAAGPTLAAPLSQASDFPLSVGLQLADLRLDLEGAASREPGGTRFHFAFDIDSEELTWIRELAGIDLPQIGGFQLSGQLSNRQATLEVSEIAGSVGPTSVHGRLALSLAAEKPEVSGRFSVGQLDLAPWLEPSSDSDSSEPLPFSLLSAVNADLQLTMKELTGLEIAVDDIDLEIEIANGVMSIPATLRAAAIPLSAQLEVNSDREVPRVALRVEARDLTLGELDGLVDIPDNVDGRFGALDLQMTSTGHSIDALSANLLIEADATETVVAGMDETGEEPLEVFFSQAHATHRPGNPLAATASGTLLDESFTIDLQTASLTDLIESDLWPLSMGIKGAGATVDLEGTLEKNANGLDLDLALGLSGDRLGDLENWLGFPAHADLAYHLNGQLTSSTGTNLLRIDDSSIGRTQFGGRFEWSSEDEDAPFRVDLHAKSLDLRQIRDLSSPVTDLDTEQDVIGIDMPILPSKRSFHDAQIELTVDRLLRDPVDLTNANASLQIRQGRLERSPFSFAYDTQQFTGEISLDLRQEIPRLALEFRGHGKGLGEILEQEGIIHDFRVVAKELDLRIDASGASVREMMQSADLSGELVDIRWEIQPAGLEKPVRVQLETMDLSGPQGEPIVLTAHGHLNQEPLDLRLTLRSPDDLHSRQTHSVPFDITIGLAAATIDLDGEAHLPITESDFDMRMVIAGTTLATLSEPLDIDLPDLGPYRLQSRLATGGAGFTLKDIDFALGESDIKGEVSYERVDDRPTFKAELTSDLLRTEDFIKIEGRATGEEQERLTDDQDTEISPARPKLTLDHFRGFDAAIRLEAERILTAEGTSDDMVLDLNLERGKLDLVVDRLQDNDGKAALTAHVRPRQSGLEVDVRARWEHQPYGLLADMLSPGTAKGSWSMDLDLQSRGSNLDELAASLSGHFYFADYPVDFNATIFDLWGGGLLGSLLPVFQLGGESRVNCTVGMFQVDQGVLTPSLLTLDATRTRVKGRGTIDLPGDEIRLRLKPRPKQRSLINLSTPVTISGSLNDPDVQISKGGLAVTFFRLSLWVYTVWRDIVRKPLPADGQDVCVDPFATPLKQ